MTGPDKLDLARRLLDAVVLARLSLPRPRGLCDLDLLALSVLRRYGKLNVGAVQQRLGVKPAQMSRVVNRLEGRAPPFILCQWNPEDRRKIDLTITDAGSEAVATHQRACVRDLAALLGKLADADANCLGRLLARIHELLEAA